MMATTTATTQPGIDTTLSVRKRRKPGSTSYHTVGRGRKATADATARGRRATGGTADRGSRATVGNRA